MEKLRFNPGPHQYCIPIKRKLSKQMTFDSKEMSYPNKALSLDILGEYANAIHHDIACSNGTRSTSTKEMMITARALVRKIAATVQDWNARVGSELLCVNYVRHLDPHTSENSGSHHLYHLYTEPQQVARKVVFTGPCVGEAGAAGPSNRSGAKVNLDNSAKKSKDGK